MCCWAPTPETGSPPDHIPTEHMRSTQEPGNLMSSLLPVNNMQSAPASTKNPSKPHFRAQTVALRLLEFQQLEHVMHQRRTMHAKHKQEFLIGHETLFAISLLPVSLLSCDCCLANCGRAACTPRQGCPSPAGAGHAACAAPPTRWLPVCAPQGGPSCAPPLPLPLPPPPPPAGGSPSCASYTNQTVRTQ